MNAAQNSQRWATYQLRQARAASEAAALTTEHARAEKLYGLRDMAKMMAGLPHMAATLASVQAEIARLEAAQ